MQPGLPEHLQAELETAASELQQRLSTAMQTTLTDAIREVLNQFKTFRHVLLYFNTQPDWAAVLEIIRTTLRVDIVQVIALEGLDDLSYHGLPEGREFDEDVVTLLHEGLTIDDVTPGGLVRLGTLLAVNDDLLGVVMVARHNGPAFSDYERALLSNFSDELAVALHNLELYGLLREQANRLAILVKQKRADGEHSERL